MLRSGLVLSILVMALGCSARHESRQPPVSQAAVDKLVLLTRGGCVNTATMRANLDEALRALRLASNYTIVDLDTLSEADPRSGYPTPTLLYENRDVFGLAQPQPPFPDPT